MGSVAGATLKRKGRKKAAQTRVNSQIADSVRPPSVKVVGEAPAQSMAMVYLTMAPSISLAMENAMQAQGGLQQFGNAVTSSGVRMIFDAANGSGSSDK